MDSRYTIVLGLAEHIPELGRIELACAALFDEDDLPLALHDDTADVEMLREAQAAGRLFVAVEGGAVAGFAVGTIVDGQGHLAEMDVHPDHGRRGIGKALVMRVVEWARAEGHGALTLTTFRHVPWNGPFYARLGFEYVNEDALGENLLAILEAEAAVGLDPAKRVAMRLSI